MGTVTLGGERLGSGKKQKIHTRNFERSTQDLSYLWRSTMSSGTLVPFMKEIGLSGDTFDIDLEADIKTHPTVGPLFGSFKVQLDVFVAPIRLYQGKLHMNMLNIGMSMEKIKLPQIVMTCANDSSHDNAQINPSSIYSYLGMRGLGRGTSNPETSLMREFNAIPYIMYWDVYKSYYANKQEEIGVVIHNPQNFNDNIVVNAYVQFQGANDHYDILNSDVIAVPWSNITGKYILEFGNSNEPDYEEVYVLWKTGVMQLGDTIRRKVKEVFKVVTWDSVNQRMTASKPYDNYMTPAYTECFYGYNYDGDTAEPSQLVPQLSTFPLTNIDKMRMDILGAVAQAAPVYISEATYEPYGLGLGQGDTGVYSKLSSQEGLAIKCYQSDLFNNWVSTEWLTGSNGVSEVTAIDTSSGSFTMDTLILSRKVYDMLTRIAITGGSYDDWLDSVYAHERTRSVESPMYMGGLSKELAFQEVISNAVGNDDGITQPLGTLAGRGVLTKKNKGGKVRIKVDEPSYVMGIISLTPRLDYSQGNKFDVNLKSMNDFHKPALDEIGFQDLITDQMAWWDTKIEGGQWVYKSAGKQPAWINYMTNVNQVLGNFAVENNQMFMVLNRKYEQGEDGIKDLTTYIDPTKFNHIFADARLDAQNFWAQISVNIEKRTKMSAKVIPNL